MCIQWGSTIQIDIANIQVNNLFCVTTDIHSLILIHERYLSNISTLFFLSHPVPTKIHISQ